MWENLLNFSFISVCQIVLKNNNNGFGNFTSVEGCMLTILSSKYQEVCSLISTQFIPQVVLVHSLVVTFDEGLTSSVPLLQIRVLEILF